ncbi:MAG: hypothetical protein WD249_00195 [Gaiellaceae bacterium]
MKRIFAIAAVLVGTLAYAGVAQAATATLSGTAVVEGDHVKIVSDFSDAGTTNDAGAVSFTGTGVTDFNSLTTLSAEFNVTDDACLGGSPRFEVDFAGTDNNLFVYLGAYNATTGQFDCAPSVWISSGNLIGTPDTDKRYDTSKFAGGTFYDTYAHAKTLLGRMTVESIRFVADGGWAFADKEQTVLLRTATVNQHVFRFGTGTRMDNPARICKELRSEMGASAFATMWGTNPNKRNAFGKCVSHHAKMQQQATAAAQNECKGLKGQARRQCVATSASARFEVRRTALAAAAESCATELRASRSAFLQKYGKGSKRNVKAAFAACVRSKR